jgi:hypothetical protein
MTGGSQKEIAVLVTYQILFLNDIIISSNGPSEWPTHFVKAQGKRVRFVMNNELGFIRPCEGITVAEM